MAQAFQDQLEVLRFLPTAMMWRGDFDPTQQYYKNEVVIAPNKGTYICIVVSAAIGVDPIFSPEWFIFTGGIGGLHTLNVENGLSNVGSSTNVIVQNDGVRTLVAGCNIFLSGTPQNRIINSTNVGGIIDGLGISSYGGPPVLELQNEGVRTISTGGGLYLSTPPPNATISQSNVLSVTAGNGILNSGTAQDPVLENNGVRSLTLVDFQNTGTPTELILNNEGVVSLSNTNNTLRINNFLGGYTVSCPNAPFVDRIFNASSVSFVGWPVSDAASGYMNFTCISTYLNNALANGLPAGNSLNLTIELGMINIKASGRRPILATKGSILAVDATQNPPARSLIYQISYTGLTASDLYPIEFSLGTVNLNINQLRSNGLRAITGFEFITPADGYARQEWTMKAYGSAVGVWTLRK